MIHRPSRKQIRPRHRLQGGGAATAHAITQQRRQSSKARNQTIAAAITSKPASRAARTGRDWRWNQASAWEYRQSNQAYARAAQSASTASRRSEQHRRDPAFGQQDKKRDRRHEERGAEEADRGPHEWRPGPAALAVRKYGADASSRVVTLPPDTRGIADGVRRTVFVACRTRTPRFTDGRPLDPRTGWAGGILVERLGAPRSPPSAATPTGRLWAPRAQLTVAATGLEVP